MGSEWTCISYCKWGYSSHVRKYQRVLSLKLTIAPENRPYPKGKGSSPNPHFSGATLVSGSVIIFQHVSWTPQQSWVSLPTWWRKSQTFPTEICRRVRSSAVILMKLCLMCPICKVFQTSHQHLKLNGHIIPVVTILGKGVIPSPFLAPSPAIQQQRDAQRMDMQFDNKGVLLCLRKKSDSSTRSISSIVLFKFKIVYIPLQNQPKENISGHDELHSFCLFSLICWQNLNHHLLKPQICKYWTPCEIWGDVLLCLVMIKWAVDIHFPY